METQTQSPQLEADKILNELRRLAAKPRLSTEEKKQFDALEHQHAVVSGAYSRSQLARLVEMEDKAGIPRRPVDDVEAMVNYRNYLLSGKPRNMIMSATSGGYLVPTKIWPTFVAMLKAADQIFDPSVVTWLELSGDPVNIPMLDDTAIVAQKIDENNITPTYSDITFDEVAFGRAATWRSGWVAAPRQLAADSAYPLDFVLNQVFAARIARGAGAALVSTIITGAESAGTAVGSAGNTGGTETGANSIGTDDLATLFGSVDQAYSSSPNAGWMMQLSTFVKLLTIKDKQGRPVLRPEKNADGRYLILTKPVYFCPSVPAVSTGNKSVLFGDLSRIAIRADKDSYSVLRSEERLSEYLQFGYQAYLRLDSALLRQSGSDSPIKYLQNA